MALLAAEVPTLPDGDSPVRALCGAAGTRVNRLVDALCARAQFLPVVCALLLLACVSIRVAVCNFRRALPYLAFQRCGTRSPGNDARHQRAASFPDRVL